MDDGSVRTRLPPGIPRESRFALSRPLRFAKGAGHPHPRIKSGAGSGPLRSGVLCTTLVCGNFGLDQTQRPPLSLGHFPRERGKPCPVAALFTLTLALSHRGRGDFCRGARCPAPLDSGFRRNDVLL